MPAYDISAPLHEGLVTWPGIVERFERHVVTHIDRGDAMTVSTFELGGHAGTHVDAPNHFVPGAGGIESVALHDLVGPAEVVAVGPETDVVTADVLQASGMSAGMTRLLVQTRNSGWSRSGARFDESFVALDETAAQWCIDREIRLVGIDYLSVEPFDADTRDFPVHRALLGAGVVVVESLDLAGITPGTYELVVLPVLVPGSDGAPARAVLWST